jgi:hypothetical protein
LKFQCPQCDVLVGVLDCTHDPMNKTAGFRCESCGSTSYLPLVAANSHATSGGRAQTEKSPSPETSGFSEDQIGAIETRLKSSIAEEDFIRVWQDFRTVLDSFDDPKIHNQKIQTAQLKDAMPLFAAGYKAVLEIFPENEEAQKGQDRIMALAMQSFQSENQSAAPAKRFVNALAFLSLLALFGCAFWFLLQILFPADAG